MNETEIPKITVELDQLRKIYKAAKQAKVKEVSFEYVVGSLFPHIIDNIKEELRRQHMAGYAEGLKEGKKNEE